MAEGTGFNRKVLSWANNLSHNALIRISYTFLCELPDDILLNRTNEVGEFLAEMKAELADETNRHDFATLLADTEREEIRYEMMLNVCRKRNLEIKDFHEIMLNLYRKSK